MNTDHASVNALAVISSDSPGKRTYTVPEIAESLRISKSKAYELCNQDLFKTVRIGRSVRVSKVAFDEWLDRQIT